MDAQTEHPIVVHRRREQDRPVDDRRLRRLVAHGEQFRITAGSYAPAREWKKLTPMQKHLTRVLEVADRSRGPRVFTHSAAAAVHGIDRIGEWPELVEVRIPTASGGRSSGSVRRRALGFDGVELLPWRGHFVTSPAQTAIDLAAEGDFMQGVVAMDQAQWGRREGGGLTRLAHIRDLLSAQTRRGLGRVHRAIAFSTDLADSVRESQSRVLIDKLGFPVPVLQRPFILPGLGTARVDFWFEDFEHVGEFDGVGKYLDPVLLDRRTPEEALMAEKDRGDALRRLVRGLSRWRTPDLRDPQRLYDILVADGLPSRLPRPRRSARW